VLVLGPQAQGVIGVGRVEVDRLLDQPKAQRIGVEVDVRLRLGET
jgi:hypothetical protein